MNKTILFLLILSFSAIMISFQSCRNDDPMSPIDTTIISDTTRIFNNTYGTPLSDLVTGAVQSGDGGVIICGYTISSSFGDNDIFIMKLDGRGGIIWSNIYGGSGNDQATSLIRTSDGNFIVSGHTTSLSASFDPFTIKINSSGDIQWSNVYRWWNEDYSNNLIQTSDGGYIMTGYSNSFGSGGYDVYSLKLDQSGGIMWARCYGGPENDFGNAIQETTDGGYIIGGYTFSFGAFGDGYVIKLFGDGAVRWSKNYGGAGFDNIKDLKKASNGFIACGSTVSFGLIDENAYVFNIDNQDGFVYWTRTFDGALAGPSSFYKAFQSPDGGFVLSGTMQNSTENQNDMVFMKLFGDGAFNFAKGFGGVGSDVSTSLSVKEDGGYILGGNTTSFGAGSNDAYVVSIRSDGTGCFADNPFTPIGGDPVTEVNSPATAYISVDFYETVPFTWNIAQFGVVPNTQCVTYPKSAE